MNMIGKKGKNALSNRRKGRTALALVLAVLLLLCFAAPAPASKSYAAASRFTLTGETYPGTLEIGSSFSLKGTLKGTNQITAVDVGVLNRATGAYVSSFHFKKTGLNTKSYSIADADSSLKFGKLPAGEYYYRIRATDSKGTQTVLKKAFTVRDPDASFWLTGLTYPVSLKKGDSFSLKGTLKGVRKITAVDVGVLKKSSGYYVSGFHFKKTGLGTKSYSLADADSALKFGKLPAGEYYYRIKATDSKGTKTVLKKAFKVTGTKTSTTTAATFTLSGETYPTTLNKGSSFSIKGTLKSSKTITAVHIGVINKATGKYVSGFHYKKTGLSTKSYSIAKADSALKFGKLPLGEYYYRIKATTASGTKTVLKKAFVVKDPNASFWLTGATYPVSLKKGASFTVKGTLKGVRKIKVVSVGVLKKSTGKYVSGFRFKKTGLSTKSYSLAAADSALKFGKLPAGEYYYCIRATDSKGTKTVLKKAFKVTAATGATYTLTGETYPTTLKIGTSFGLEGMLTCNKTITAIDIGVLNKKTGYYMSGFHFKKTGLSTKSYNIEDADSSLKFGKLPAGEYYYRIKATTASGTKVVLKKAFKVTDPAGQTSSMTDAEFKASLQKQGFPAAYVSRLMSLHKAHPAWVFYADKTGLAWSDVLAKEKVLGVSLIEPTADDAYINQKYKSRNYDGTLKQASDAAIMYYLDPRNFLDEQDIYQFLDQRSTANPGTKAQVTSLVSRNSCFMNTPTYISTLMTAGKNSGVNPVVLTVMVIQEQGWRGTSDLISGRNSKYPGIYNHFNVGAYTADGMTKIIRGLWWAKGAGVGATTFGRPWNSIEKSLTGGAMHYGAGYIDNDQYTYYTKKFNVMNGLGELSSHQYMTNIDGACSEGRLLRQAYTADDTKLVFRIPVYTGMPTAVCPAP